VHLLAVRLHRFLGDQPVQQAVEGADPQPYPTSGELVHLADDAVAVPRPIGGAGSTRAAGSVSGRDVMPEPDLSMHRESIHQGAERPAR
jgi:hypothetical protein